MARRKRKPSGRLRLPRSTRPPKVETPKKAYRRRRLKHPDLCVAGLEDWEWVTLWSEE